MDVHSEFNFEFRRALRRAKMQAFASGLLHPLLHQTAALLHHDWLPMLLRCGPSRSPDECRNDVIGELVRDVQIRPAD